MDYLRNFLLEHHPENLLMPCDSSDKRPLFPHKQPGAWSWDMFDRAFDENKHQLCILLKTIVVIDFDDHLLAQEWTDKYPASFKTCPAQRTKKGVHYFFLRTELCDTLRLYDKARVLPTIDLDVKTVCRTGTSGCIMVHPSKHKHWVPGRELWAPDRLQPIPDELVRTLCPSKDTQPQTQALAVAAPENSSKVFSPPSFLEVKNFLEGVVGFRAVTMVQEREAGYNFDADRSAPCPLCETNTHQSNYWYVMSVCPCVYTVKSYSTLCRQKVFSDDTAIDCLDTDEPYASLFRRNYRDTIMWTGKRFMIFREHRWRHLPTEALYVMVAELSKATLLKLHEVLSSKLSDDILATGQSKVSTEKVKKGLRYIRKNSNIVNIAHMVKMMVATENADFDTNPFLLGVENGVLDLSTHHFELRDGRPSDMVSRSVGYAFDLKAAEKFLPEVNTLFTKIYPFQEERLVVRRYLAYCLLGYHPQKKALLLTDKRGGYNAKSTVCKCIRSMLGHDYSAKPQACFLYKTRNSSATIDSHSAGLLSYRGVRVATVEELDPKQQLDTQFIKDVNGGRTSFRGRVIRSDEHVEFEWVTRQVLCFNGGNMPSFDVSDEALLKRFIVVQHRARFCPSLKDFEKHKHEPYTYLADPEVDDKIFSVWRPAILLWCLQGLEEYHDVGFTVVPPTCEAWLHELACEKDLVRAFLLANLEQAPDPRRDFVTRADLYQRYKLDTPEERDKHTSLGKQKFTDRCIAVLGADSFKEGQHGPSHAKGVFLGWRWAAEACPV